MTSAASTRSSEQLPGRRSRCSDDDASSSASSSPLFGSAKSSPQAPPQDPAVVHAVSPGGGLIESWDVVVEAEGPMSSPEGPKLYSYNSRGGASGGDSWGGARGRSNAADEYRRGHARCAKRKQDAFCNHFKQFPRLLDTW